MVNSKDLAYHKNQFNTIYRSTKVFDMWLMQMGVLNDTRNVVDIACGAGSNTIFFAKKYPQINFLGIDYDAQIINLGNKKIDEDNIYNATLELKDIYNIKAGDYSNIDGVVMLQTLSWLKNYQEPLKHILTIKPKWIAISSLFYEGEIDAFITLHNYYRPSNKCDYSMSYYNIYSLPRIKDFLKSHGYNKFKYKKFEIDINIKQTTKDIGTYTKMTIDKKNLQFSGPLFLPWYFIYAEK